ncbi:BA14K family protein [Mesorhizobium sp. ASY16-5R]|uniref:BA14K family protein n=1 Tax=Mesorhizobium sp. ASY16-5R TaxID=3445772 RepID=UPI003F9F6D1B
MKKFLSGLCASALAFSVTVVGLVPAEAAQVYVPKAAVQSHSDVIQVQSNSERRKFRREGRRDRREWRHDNRRDRREWRRDNRRDRWDRREWRREARRDHRRGYYRGYRGYDYYRPGYRRYDDGFWYPAGAFVAGAIIGGALANQPRVVVNEGSSHTQWCYNRYRSYRAYDNTFQPNYGPRRECISPY